MLSKFFLEVKGKLLKLILIHQLNQIINWSYAFALCRAESFWCTGTLSKFFTAWAGTSAAAHRKAGTLCERHLLQKGLQALKIAVHHRRQDVQDFRAKHRGRLMAKYWLKVGGCLGNSGQVDLVGMCSVKAVGVWSMCGQYVLGMWLVVGW